MQAVRHRLDRLTAARQQAQRRQVADEPLRPQIELEGRLERGERQLADAQCPLHRELADPADGLGAADDEAGLRPAEQLVAGERDHVATGTEHLLRQRLARQPVRRQIDERAAAEVGGERNVAGMGDARKRGFIDRCGEAFDRVVAGVHLHHQGGAGVDGALVVLRVGAVGGPDLHHVSAGACHHVGHAEGAADLDELAARDHDLAVARHRRHRQQHRGGVVVDHRRGFGAGDAAEQRLDNRVAVAAAAGRQVVFEVVRRRHQRDQARERGVGEQRPAEVGVDHGAGEVQHGTQAWCQAGGDAGNKRRAQRIGLDLAAAQLAGHGARPQLVEQASRFGRDQRMSMLGEQAAAGFGAQEPVDRRQILRTSHRTVNLGLGERVHQPPPAPTAAFS